MRGASEPSWSGFACERLANQVGRALHARGAMQNELGQLVCWRKASRVEGRTASYMGLLNVLGPDEDLGLGVV